MSSQRKLLVEQKAKRIGNALLSGWQDLFEQPISDVEDGEEEEGQEVYVGGFRQHEQRDYSATTTSRQDDAPNVAPVVISVSESLQKRSEQCRVENERAWRRMLDVQHRLDVDACLDEVKTRLACVWERGDADAETTDSEEDDDDGGDNGDSNDDSGKYIKRSSSKTEEGEHEKGSDNSLMFVQKVHNTAACTTDAIHCHIGEAVIGMEHKQEIVLAICDTHKDGCDVIVATFMDQMQLWFGSQDEDSKCEPISSSVTVELEVVRKRLYDVSRCVGAVKSEVASLTELAADAAEMILSAEDESTSDVWQTCKRKIHTAERNVFHAVHNVLSFLVPLLFHK